MSTNSLLKDTVIITGLRICARGIGFLIPFFIAAWFGISCETDAFFFAYGLVIYLNSTFEDTLESFIVPYIVEIKSHTREIGVFVGNVCAWAVVCLGLSSCLIYFILPLGLTGLTKFSSENRELIALLFLEITPLIILSPVTSIISGTLNAHRHFKIPAISPAVRSLVALVFIYFLKDRLGIHSISLGYALGEIFRLLIFLLTLVRMNLLQLNFTLKLSSQAKNFLKDVSYRITGMMAVRFNPVISRIMASWLGLGAVSLLDYTDRIYAIPVAFFVQGFLVAVLSHWSEAYYSESPGDDFRARVLKTCRAVFLIALIINVLFWIFKSPLTTAIYGGRMISGEQIESITRLLGLYLLGFTPLLIVMTLGHAFIVRKQAKFLMVTGIANCLVHTALNFILMKPFGLAGIVMSTAIVQFLMMLIYLWWFQKSSYRPKGT